MVFASEYVEFFNLSFSIKINVILFYAGVKFLVKNANLMKQHSDETSKANKE